MHVGLTQDANRTEDDDNDGDGDGTTVADAVAVTYRRSLLVKSRYGVYAAGRPSRLDGHHDVSGGSVHVAGILEITLELLF